MIDLPIDATLQRLGPLRGGASVDRFEVALAKRPASALEHREVEGYKICCAENAVATTFASIPSQYLPKDSFIA
jgi:hypothetical protein